MHSHKNKNVMCQHKIIADFGGSYSHQLCWLFFNKTISYGKALSKHSLLLIINAHKCLGHHQLKNRWQKINRNCQNESAIKHTKEIIVLWRKIIAKYISMSTTKITTRKIGFKFYKIKFTASFTVLLIFNMSLRPKKNLW